jgi:hypothetical protein
MPGGVGAVGRRIGSHAGHGDHPQVLHGTLDPCMGDFPVWAPCPHWVLRYYRFFCKPNLQSDNPGLHCPVVPPVCLCVSFLVCPHHPASVWSHLPWPQLPLLPHGNVFLWSPDAWSKVVSPGCTGLTWTLLFSLPEREWSLTILGVRGGRGSPGWALRLSPAHLAPSGPASSSSLDPQCLEVLSGLCLQERGECGAMSGTLDCAWTD